MLKRWDHLIGCLFVLGAAVGQEANEDFNTLSHWMNWYFAGIPRHSTYSIVSENGNQLLQADTNNSASGLIWDREINLYETPLLSWSWKIENIIEAGNVALKKADDYPIRIYIIFPFDPDQSNPLERIKYKAARAIYGEYPPQSSLNYIWANHKSDLRIIPNAYTKKSMMIVLESSTDKAGVWLDETVDLIRDYEAALHRAAPKSARLVILADSDNTGGEARAWLDNLRLYRDPRSLLPNQSKSPQTDDQ